MTRLLQLNSGQINPCWSDTWSEVKAIVLKWPMRMHRFKCHLEPFIQSAGIIWTAKTFFMKSNWNGMAETVWGRPRQIYVPRMIITSSSAKNQYKLYWSLTDELVLTVHGGFGRQVQSKCLWPCHYTNQGIHINYNKKLFTWWLYHYSNGKGCFSLNLNYCNANQD